MFFEMPTKIYEEKDCVINHRRDLALLGKKALIVTGRSSAEKCGALSDVKEALEAEGVKYAHFKEIEENPSIETVMRAKRVGLETGCDFVIGIGGGSPMDAAKAIALLMKDSERDEKYLYDKGKSDALPIAEIPTTCGTGSEATPYSILTIHEKRTKGSIAHRIFPTLSLTDAKYLTSAPKSLIANTAVDALGHLFESRINSNATECSNIIVDAGLKIWKRSRDVLEGAREPEYEDLRNMMNASTIAGMAISHTSTSVPHGLSYCLTYDCGVPHGKAVGYFLSGYIKKAEREEREYVLNGAGFKDVSDFESFFKAVCGEVKRDEGAIERGVKALWENKQKLKNCPYPVTLDMITKIAEGIR